MTIERPMFPPRAESVDPFSRHSATGQSETEERTSDSPRPVTSQSNVLTFPRILPASSVRELHNISFGNGRTRPRANMHTFVFRSYDLIVASSEADLIRDVRCDTHKAATKLNSIRQQIQRDREHAAARENLLTMAEAKLTAAIGDASRGVTGLQPRSPPIAPAATRDLGAAYEQLLRQYVEESVKWHAADNSTVAYEEADEEMCKISEQMEPLEELIKKIDIDPLDQDCDAKLRTVALKDLRYKLPGMHDEWQISDGFGDDLEMFWQVLEFVGLADYARSIEQRVKMAHRRRLKR